MRRSALLVISLPSPRLGSWEDAEGGPGGADGLDRAGRVAGAGSVCAWPNGAEKIDDAIIYEAAYLMQTRAIAHFFGLFLLKMNPAA